MLTLMKPMVKAKAQIRREDFLERIMAVLELALPK
jgi:hypothetical protein